MLKLITGRAGSGKTAAMLDDIMARAERREKSILVVPEQYSHDAERQLCAHCGNSVSLWAEVLSFSALSRRVFTACPDSGDKPLSDGGRLLVMELAFSSVFDRLISFSAVRRRSDFLTGLIKLRDELAQSMLSPSMLTSAAVGAGSALENKLRDLSLILEAYPAFIPAGYYDPADRLNELARLLPASGVIGDAAVYFDGFTDFTAQQFGVIDALMAMGSQLCVCLNCEGIEDDGILFTSARRTLLQLMRLADERFVKYSHVPMSHSRRSSAEQLRFLEANLFSDAPAVYAGQNEGAVRLVRADSLTQECEAAASMCLELVREKGWRWRDISVTARGWEDYGTAAQSIFEKYGIPVLMNKRSGILEKPVLLMVLSALDTIENGFDYQSIFRYLKTGLAGISADECDELENYVLRWRIRGRRLWTAREGWTSDPDGMGVCPPERQEKLRRINDARLRAAMPVERLAQALEEAQTAREKTMALWNFLVDAGVPERLESRAGELFALGDLQLSDEYVQLWDVLIDALEQFSGILGDALISTDEFARLLKLVLKSYDIGTIPAALDRVNMGEMDRMRRRDLKCLIVLGAGDERLPMRGDGSGILSDQERDILSRAGLRLAEDADGRLLREMDLIYTSLTLPTRQLILLRTDTGESRPSFVVTRVANLFGIREEKAGQWIYTAAAQPCFELAATAIADGATDLSTAAADALGGDEHWRSRLDAARSAANIMRGSLSRDRAEGLYGKSVALTASRVESFYRCRYSYFMEYGLKAKPRRRADFDKPEFGTFVHFVLEGVLKELEVGEGFAAGLARCGELTKKYIEEYTESYMGGLVGRSERFKYLYRRLGSTVTQIVYDTVDELSRSDFRPLDFELDFSRGGDMPPAVIEGEDWTVTVRGKVDRADGWVHDGKLYVRVVDYKTGVKKFSLSDVLCGMNMQMLIYLFVLGRSGQQRYGMPVVPAGVLYTPARDPIISADSSASEDEVNAARAKQLVRSGLILDDGDVIEAMEHGSTPKYIPVKFKGGTASGDSLADLEKLGKLSQHIDSLLLEMGKELRGGSMLADPFYRNDRDNACAYCRFYEACRFGEAQGDKNRRIYKLKTPEAWQRMEVRHGKT